MKVKLTSREIQSLVGGTVPDFPKYATQIINLANQNAQGTRPRVVGQQTELIREFPGSSLLEWQEWYQERYPEALADATTRIYAMVEQLKAAIVQIDEAMVRRWVEDLVLVKTFIGLRFQEAILKKVAEHKNLSYRDSTPEEESRGIDGYIGTLPVSIKPDTYKVQSLLLPEHIEIGIIYYSKLKDGISLEYDF
jgi:hypothetical protein